MEPITIRPATTNDANAIWAIFSEVVAEGLTFLYDETVRREDVLNAWYAPSASSFVACIGDSVAGAYTVRPNHPGRGWHVGNATYMVGSAWRGHGIGRLLGEHSLGVARGRRFVAMQYNAVVSTNTGAVKLWQSLGFEVIGRVPQGFRHPTEGLVDLLVMYRFL